MMTNTRGNVSTCTTIFDSCSVTNLTSMVHTAIYPSFTAVTSIVRALKCYMSSSARFSDHETARSPSAQSRSEPLHTNYREQKGERRRKRHETTKLRHAIQAEQAAKNARPPETSMEAAERWNAFYLTKSSLYKDRHLLRSQLLDAVSPSVAADPSVHVPPLNAQQLSVPQVQDTVLVEAGCGAGASVYPLLRANPRLHVIAFDISEQAIHSLQHSPEYSPERVTAFVADVSRPDSFLPTVVNARPQGANFVTAVWTLSALPPRSQLRAARALTSALAPGGTLYIRDYGHGDMRERKFAEAGRRVHLPVDSDGPSTDEANEANVDRESRLFLRGDGTYAYFFTVEEVQSMFLIHGLIRVSCAYEERTVQNRKLHTTMSRRWVVGHFRKPLKGDCEGGGRSKDCVEDYDLSIRRVFDEIGDVHDA